MAHKTIALTTELQEHLHEVGFEPTKAKPPDLKSGPFDHSGTHAYKDITLYAYFYKIKSQINFIKY